MKWNPLLKSQIYYQPRASMVQPKNFNCIMAQNTRKETRQGKARQGNARSFKQRSNQPIRHLIPSHYNKIKPQTL